jgi:hypothetical protein
LYTIYTNLRFFATTKLSIIKDICATFGIGGQTKDRDFSGCKRLRTGKSL